ncbi:protein of unknown function DUF62 [Limnospira maxima CS-328]|uniref:SAM-dependent chlorinase/fluorinase n=1 Tax=Limnospira maxima CS-328 TaxID=513049 RepID=B5W1M4_LIMMA|nr:SAM-dependent chlorinase/fluorinase [Limnospira maxima]EDZ94634.1 protein of unknown function DUF62 [Limnospira maxima CS-328]MDC0840338.1 SAM-dependent chlorinase/fluorinase [Limnoraphis robusta]
MSVSGIITLLTDFGLSDVYVGVMKGVLSQINPHLTVIDLTHEIPPQNLMAARFCLMNAYPYFPQGTVHMAVVDPGVGTERKAIALQLPNGYVVGPDNGLFGGLIKQYGVITAVELTNHQYWRNSQPSTTFHGRDIFSPVAAYLASGVQITDLGTVINSDTLMSLSMPNLEITETSIKGSIQYIDRFGNLITNIPGDMVADKSWNVSFPECTPSPTISSHRTYGEVQPGHLLTLIGSHGWIEIAANGDSAKSRLQIDWGATVIINY